jgi:hypothetical protein
MTRPYFCTQSYKGSSCVTYHLRQLLSEWHTEGLKIRFSLNCAFEINFIKKSEGWFIINSRFSTRCFCRVRGWKGRGASPGGWTRADWIPDFLAGCGSPDVNEAHLSPGVPRRRGHGKHSSTSRTTPSKPSGTQLPPLIPFAYPPARTQY